MFTVLGTSAHAPSLALVPNRLEPGPVKVLPVFYDALR